ncbi:selT/selW/selH seleno protein domain-containing protein [Xylariaceae sp. FL0255]|nr:selT/selW/selH seleno protein domain-containing protein [Xylariaceae sp. FL0255]
MAGALDPTTPSSLAPTPTATSQLLPRVTIRFCTQCKWMLRAAYFAQELLSTFSTSLGEVALQPATGGIFVVEIFYQSTTTPTPTTITITEDPNSTTANPNPTIQQRVLWDRKIEGGFPETKELKRRVRDIIEPDRNLGHVDRDYHPNSAASKPEPNAASTQQQSPAETSTMSSQGQELSNEPAKADEPTTTTADEQVSNSGPFRRPGRGIIPKMQPKALKYHTVEPSPAPQAPEKSEASEKNEGEVCEDCQ